MRTIWGLIAALLFASICQGQINPPPGAPNTIRVQFIIRDFVGQYPNGVPAGANRTTHPDFQRVNARDSGIVNRVLGGDRKPAYNTTFRSTANTWTNATTFSWAWNDVPGVNLRLTRLFDMPWSTSTGLYTYSNSDFFPINNDGFGNYGSTGKNFHFCLEYHTQFVYQGNEQFTFTGDDDVYFFVNNILFVDLGGVHGAITENRNLTNQAQVLRDFGMTVGNVYNFDFFFCERHTSASNLRMSTNILLNNCAFLDACGTCSATEPVIKVNPCNSLNCNNGLCNCQNATCVCNPGWTNGPAGFCSQNCGDGIVQGDEQCDVGGLTTPCCVNCRFAAANTPCPSAGRPCVNYVCTGNSTTCGIARPVGTPCTGSGSPPQCQQFQCTASDGSVCGLVANPSLSCTDNDACTTDVCLPSGQCQSTSRPCSATSCRNAGTCDRITGQCSVGTPKANNIGCPDLNATACRQPTCQSGECTLTPKAVNTPCGSASADGCSTQVCDGTTGSCISVEIADKQGTTASCPQPAPGSCVQSLCSGLGCADSPLADGTTCTAALTLNSCQRRGCVNGVCSVLPDSAREGQACTDGGALANFGDDQCNVKVCTNGQCVRKANTAIDGNNCSIASGGAANPEEQCRTYKCQAGTCTRANVNEGSVCTNSSLTTNNCQRLQCTTGTCSVRPFNANGVCAASINNGCTFYRCDDVGNCNSQFAPVNISCGPTDLKCNLSFCTATGTCEQQPVLCNSQVCGGKLKCNQTLGVCEIPAGEIVSCCGNGVIDTAAEECDDPTDPCCVNCLWAAPLTPCGATNECNPKRCTLVAPAPSKNTTCTNNYQNNIACSSAPAASNQCKQLRCGNNTGVCTEVNKLDDTPCTLSDVPFCGEAVCRSGACVVVPNLALANQDCSSAYGAVPECNVAVCSGTACVLSPTNQDGDCTVLPATECRDRKCKAGKCEYTFDAYPKSLTTTCTALTSNTNCLQPGCDGLGNCVLLNVTAGTSCVRDFNEECTVPECDGAGVCALKPIRIDQSCTAARDQQCQVSNCDVNGNCVVSNVNNGTPCTRTDAGQCQDAQCSNGACVLVNTAATQRTCEPTPNLLEDRSCFLYYCQADGTCETPTNKPNGSPCTDSNLCDVDTCTDGVCVHAVNVVCNAPTQPCEVPIGTCVAAFGNCTYGGRGQYAACNPRAAELDPRCNASISGSYRCASGAPDSVCVPACFVGGVCGDGIVQEGEDCDWGDERTGGPCCNITCKWFEDLSPCAYTDPVKVAEVEKQIADLSTASDLPALCFQQRCVLQNGLSQCVLGLNTTADKKCADSGNSKSNRTAILASVIPGALIAMLLAGLGFFFWRRAQKAAESEWLQEYLDAGNVRVENNAAFVENQGTVANAAFQPDGK